MGWKAGVAASAAVVCFGVVGAVARVDWRESHEVRAVERVTLAELARRDGATERSVRLLRVRLHPEQEVVFELCAEDPMRPERWANAMAVAVWRPAARELMTRSELTEEVLAHVRRDASSGCLTIGRGRIAEEDDYAVEALYDEPPEALSAIPLTLRVMARRPMEGPDRGFVILAWLGSLSLVLFLALRPLDAAPSAAAPPSAAAGPPAAPALGDPWEAARAEAGGRRRLPGEARVLSGLALVVASFFASRFLPAGAALGLAVGVALAAFEAGVGVALTPGPGMRRRLDTLALRRPARWWLHFPLALLAGAALVFLARWATELVPSTGRSPIQIFVSFPSGMLSFAALAVVAPLAEEVFFRGFVYGVLEKRDAILAFLGAWLLFVVAHAPQTWGQWGALVAIAVTGLGLTGLRALSGSTLVAALAHLVYNGVLALSAMF
jgi:membrane protease YdiL (CAAX protease family)